MSGGVTGRRDAAAARGMAGAGDRRTRAARWWGRLLWTSLGLNVFLLALILARVAHVGRQEVAPPPHEAPISRIIAALPPEDAMRFRAVLVARRGAILPARAAVSAAQGRLAEAIRHRPFDSPAVTAALADWREKWQRFAMIFNSAVLAGLATLSDDGRARFADAAQAEDARHAAAAARAYGQPGH